MKAYPGYLFDLDGTLVDTAPDINAALNLALESHGHPRVDESLTRHWVGHGVVALVTQAIERHGLPPEHSDDLVTAFIGHYESRIADLSRPYPGVLDALTELGARGAGLAVVTNKRTQFTLPLLEALGLDRYFDAVVCGDTAERPKPAADPALHACRLLDLAPADALFVGDSDTDVACVPADQLGADAVIDSFAELVQ